MKSDTTHDFSLTQGKSYTFKLTGAASFHPGTNGIFKTELVSRSGGDSYDRITAVGTAGSSSGFYMSAPKRICVVTLPAV
jgi:hypothetical protein